MVRNEIENLGFRVRLLNPLNDDYFQRYTNFTFYENKKFDVEANKHFRGYIMRYLDYQKKGSIQ